MKYYLTVLFFFLCGTAYAAPCTVSSFYDGYSGQFFKTPAYTPKTVGFIYGLDETYLYVYFSNGSMTGFSGVPLNVAQAFNYASNSDNFYRTTILSIYPETYTCGSPPLG